MNNQVIFQGLCDKLNNIISMPEIYVSLVSDTTNIVEECKYIVYGFYQEIGLILSESLIKLADIVVDHVLVINHLK